MAVTFGQIIPHVLKAEGGYVFDKSDRGGETMCGISKRSYPDLNIKDLTVKEATDIYRRDYWIPSKAEKLPEAIRHAYFDTVVTSGQGNAVKILQKTVNATRGRRIAVDGRIGKQTIAESKRVSIERYKAYRTLFFAQIVLKNPTQEKFWFGWYKRCQLKGNR